MNILDINSLWMILSILGVFIMIPGIGLFYGGLVRSNHSVSTILKNYIVLGPCAFLWLFVGYSLVFSSDLGGIIGNLDLLFLNKYLNVPNKLLFVFFQMMFALLTVAIISGAVVERIKFKFWIFFGLFWSLLVYYPVAHWVWAENGWIAMLGGKDFAGGLVVHITSGCSAFVAAKAIGRREDFFKLKKSYNLGKVFLGSALLWLGWFGFNAGSSLEFNNISLYAFFNTFIAGSGAIVGWLLMDYVFTPHRPSAKGINIAIICGLVGITPAAGFVGLWESAAIGLITAWVCNIGIRYFHSVFKIDDALDVFVTHGIGGFVGAILTGVFASNLINPSVSGGMLSGDYSILKGNLIGGIVVAIYSMVITKLIIVILSKITPMRVDSEDESIGLDLTQHGENIIIIKDEVIR